MARTIDPYEDEYEGGYGGGTYSPSLVRGEREKQGLVSTTPTAIPTTQATLPSMTAPAAFPTTPGTAPFMSVPQTNVNLGEFGGEYAQFDPLVSSFLNQFTAPLQRGAFMEPAPDVTQRLQNVLTTGGFIPESMETYGAGLAGLPTGGLAPTQDIVSQFAAGGQDIPVQTEATQQIRDLMQGAGLTSDYVEAARGRYLDPMREALEGRLNARQMGATLPESGATQELIRRQEQDFMRDLLLSGQSNLANYLQLGLGAGQQEFGQAAGRAGMAAGREQMLGGLGTGGITQGMNFLAQRAQQRAQQEAELGTFVRQLISGIVQRQPGILGALVSSGMGGAGDIIGALGNIFKPPPAKGPGTVINFPGTGTSTGTGTSPFFG